MYADCLRKTKFVRNLTFRLLLYASVNGLILCFAGFQRFTRFDIYFWLPLSYRFSTFLSSRPPLLTPSFPPFFPSPSLPSSFPTSLLPPFLPSLPSHPHSSSIFQKILQWTHPVWNFSCGGVSLFHPQQTWLQLLRSLHLQFNQRGECAVAVRRNVLWWFAEGEQRWHEPDAALHKVGGV